MKKVYLKPDVERVEFVSVEAITDDEFVDGDMGLGSVEGWE